VTNEVSSIDKVAQEITARQLKQWPKKGLLPTRKLSVKYVMLNRIGAANWSPTNRSSGITPALVKLVFIIGTKGQVRLWKTCLQSNNETCWDMYCEASNSLSKYD
jgi:hypothetical protein